MKSFLKSIEPFLSFTKRDKKGFFVLLILLFVVVGVRFWLKDQLAKEELLRIEQLQAIVEQKKEEETLRKEQKVVGYPTPLKISLNEQSPEKWMQLKGIGGVYGKRIVKYQKLLGGYYSKEQLLEVYGIDSLLFAKIAKDIEDHSEPYRTMNINKLALDQMKKHPYLSGTKCKQILQYREQSFPIKNIEELVENQVFTESEFARIRNYITTN